MTELETGQAAYEQFGADHVDDYETVHVLSCAESSVRLRLAISAAVKDLDLRPSPPSPTFDVEPDLGIDTW